MSNVSYSVWINYDRLGDDELDMIEYQFDTLEEVRQFKEMLPDLKLDYKNIYYDKLENGRHEIQEEHDHTGVGRFHIWSGKRKRQRCERYDNGR